MLAITHANTPRFLLNQFTVAAALLAAGCSHATAQPAPTVVPPRTPAQSAAITDIDARAATKKITAKKIILVGDSTTQVGSGWGGAFCSDHVTSFVACVNLGRGGRSTFSYRAEGSWDIALAEARRTTYDQTYVLIQFGHNDAPGKPGRSTDLATEFPANLRQYVKEVRAVGAVPVLLTPLTRRTFKNGSLQDDLAAWAVATQQVAQELNVPLVDLHATSVAAVQAMGALAALDLAEAKPPQYVVDAAKTGTTIALAAKAAPAAQKAATTEPVVTALEQRVATFDYTHLGPQGAALFSAQVASELARVVPDLRKSLRP